MTTEETKILRYLSDKLGNGGSIRSMSEGISKKYGPSYYPNIYHTIMKMEEKGIISIAAEGKNRMVRLNTGNPTSIYHISAAENQKATEINTPSEIIDRLLELASNACIISICMMKQKEYSEINRIELLLIPRLHVEDCSIINAILKIESMYNIKIDPMILAPGELSDMLGASELNHVRELIADRVVLYNSEGFWETIRKYHIDERYKYLEKFPEELDRAELAHNYNRFGYALYESASSRVDIAPEATIFSMSKSGEARVRYGAFVLLCKNIRKVNMPYMYYLFKRHERLGELKGMLKSVREYCEKEDRPRVDALIGIIPNRQKAYDKDLIKKYITQYS